MKWSMGGSRFIALLPYCQRRVGARAARCSTMLATSEESQVLKLGQAWKRAYHHHQAPPVSTVGVQDGDAPSISIGENHPLSFLRLALKLFLWIWIPFLREILQGLVVAHVVTLTAFELHLCLCLSV